MNTETIFSFKKISPKKLPLWGGVFLLFFSTLLCGIGLGEKGIWGAEGRWGTISRDMVEKGHYFKPTLNQTLYYDKPLLSYWMVAAAHHLTGSFDEFTLRLPSLFFGIASVLLVYLMGLYLLDFKKALLAGLILTTCHGMVFFSRVSQVETHTTFSATLSLFFIYLAFTTGKKKYLLSFWIFSWIACLLKGLLNLALPLAVGGLFLTAEFYFHLREREGEERPKPFSSALGGLGKALLFFLQPWSLLGCLMGATLFFLPFLLTPEGMEGLRMLWRENVARFFNAFDHKGSWSTYLGALPLLFLPWTLLLPWVFQKEKWLSQQNLRFLFFWALGTWIFFQASSSRRSYYILPILPPLSLMVAESINLWREKVNQVERILLLILTTSLSSLGLVFLLGPSLLPYQKFWGAFSLLIGSGLYSALQILPQKRTFFFSILSLATLGYLIAWGIGIPWGERFRPQSQFYADPIIQKHLCKKEGLALYKVPRDSAHFFYLHPPSPMAHFVQEEKLLEFLESPEPRFVVIKERIFRNLYLKKPKLYRKFYHYSPPYNRSLFEPRPRFYLVVVSNRPFPPRRPAGK